MTFDYNRHCQFRVNLVMKYHWLYVSMCLYCGIKYNVETELPSSNAEEHDQSQDNQ